MVTFLLAVIPLFASTPPARHPMHTSVAEVRQAAGRVEVTIRIFPDDLAAAVPRAPGADADSALASYVLPRFAVAGRDGRAIGLRWIGMERVGDVVRLQLEGDVESGLDGATISHGLLLERFPDQVNVVRAIYGGHTATLIFVPGDAAKRLP
jgi:hypothetical protein